MRTAAWHIDDSTKEQLIGEYVLIRNGQSTLSRKLRDLVVERVETKYKKDIPLFGNAAVLQTGIAQVRKNKKLSARVKLIALVSDAVYEDLTLQHELEMPGLQKTGDTLFLEGTALVSFSVGKLFMDIPDNVTDGNFMIAEKSIMPKLAKHLKL